MPRSNEAPKISKAYLLGWSDKPFKEPSPLPPPKPKRREVDLINTPGALFEWIASDGRKGKLTGISKVSLSRGPLTAANRAKASTRAGDKHSKQSKSSPKNLEANRSAKRHATPAPGDLNAALWDKLGHLPQVVNTTVNSPALANGMAQPAAVAAPVVPIAPAAPAVVASPAAVSADNRGGFTTAQDVELLRRKTENETWAQIAIAVGKKQNECKERFKQIKPKDWRPNPQGKGKDKGQKKQKQEKKEGKKEEEKKDDDNNGFLGGLLGFGDDDDKEEDKKEEGNGDDDNNMPTWGEGWGDTGEGDDGTAHQNTSWDAPGWGDANNSWNNDNNNHAWGNDNKSSKSQKATQNAGKSNKAESTSGQSNAWNNGGNGWGNIPNNSNANGSNNGRNDNGDGSGPGSFAGYRELYPDETFSMDDLARISKLFKRDNDQLFFRISCAFRDKTGRHIPEEVFRKKFGS